MTRKRILAIGDPHYHITNLSQVDEFENALFKKLETEKFAAIVCLGDLLHTHEKIHTIALNRAHLFLKRLAEFAPTYLIVGNHDYINNQQFMTKNHPYNSFDEITVVDRAMIVEFGRRKVGMCPYVPPGRFLEAMRTVDFQKCDVIFAHQEFKGCRMGAIESHEGDEWLESYPPVVSGHIHESQILGNIYYVGSAMQHAFGESGEKVLGVVTLPFKYSTLSLGLTKKKMVTKSAEDAYEFKVPDENPEMVKLVVEGTDSEIRTFSESAHCKDLQKKGVKIALKSTTEFTPESESRTFEQILLSLVRENPVAVSLLKTL